MLRGCCALRVWFATLGICLVFHPAQCITTPHLRRVGGSTPKEYGTYGYVTVREGAHMFWWHEPCLSECLSKPTAEQPLVLWLQGGPGASSTGFGQFEEVGGWHTGWKVRKHTWLEEANILFVDSPVGTGFSYVEKPSQYATDNEQIGDDLMALLAEFLRNHPESAVAPLYIFSESYGGKMAATFGRKLQEGIASGKVSANLQGVALGDSWIDGRAFTSTWGDMLSAFSLVDDKDEQALTAAAIGVDQLMADKNFTEATDAWGDMEGLVETVTAGASFYNILKHDGGQAQQSRSREWVAAALQAGGLGSSAQAAAITRTLAHYHEDKLYKFMNGPVREHLNSAADIIPDSVTWGGQAQHVFSHLSGDFMKDVIFEVDALLAHGTNVTVYNGQLDLICCTLGVDTWMQKLRWSGFDAFDTSSKRSMSAGHDTVAAFHKQHENLDYFLVLNAGHMVPADQPQAGLAVLKRVIRRASSRIYRSTRGSRKDLTESL